MSLTNYCIIYRDVADSELLVPDKRADFAYISSDSNEMYLNTVRRTSVENNI